MEKILFIGGGNMAHALIAGIFKDFEIVVVDRGGQKRDFLKKEFSARTFASIKEIAKEEWESFSAIFLAIKPQQFEEAAADMPPNLENLVVSVMAGVTIEKIASFFPNAKIIRTMPNTPALLKKAVTALFAGENITEAHKRMANKIFNAVGTSFWVKEEGQINAATAISGSGPAYIFYFLEAFQKAALALDFEKSVARELALATFDGALELAKEGDFRQLRKNVTSKGGTTESAIAVLSDADFINLIQRAVRAAHLRARELSQQKEES